MTAPNTLRTSVLAPGPNVGNQGVNRNAHTLWRTLIQIFMSRRLRINFTVLLLSVAGCAGEAGLRALAPDPSLAKPVKPPTSTSGITILPSLGAGSEATAVNDQGTIVGQSGSSAALWRLSGTSWQVTSLAGGVRATDINATGDAVGYTGGEDSYAVYWPASGGMEVIAPGSARGINDAGVVIGMRRGAPNGGAVAWTRVAGAWTEHTLPRQAGVTTGFNEVDDISSSGIIVGYAQDAGGTQHAVKWVPSSGAPHSWEPAVPIAALAGTTNSAALGIEGEDVVGIIRRCVNCPEGRDPRHWSLTGASIGSLGSEDAWPEGLNSSRVIVGAHGITGRGFKFNIHPFVWSPADPRIKDLPLPDGYTDGIAYDVNNPTADRTTKYIVGYANSAAGTRSAALWPIP